MWVSQAFILKNNNNDGSSNNNDCVWGAKVKLKS